MLERSVMPWSSYDAVCVPTLSNNAMYSEKPKRSRRLILSDRALQSSFAVVAESVSSVLVVPSMNVTGNMMGFFDLVAWTLISQKETVPVNGG